MKIIKTLLPIAGLGCVASAILPTIVSCGSSSKWIDATKKLDPEAKGFKKLAAEDIPSLDLVTKNYSEAVAHDKSIAFDDFEYHSSKIAEIANRVPEIAWKYLWDSSGFAIKAAHIYKLNTKISNFELDPVQYKATYKIQVKIDYELRIELPNLARLWQIDPNINLNLVGDLEVKFDNVPYYVYNDYVNTFIEELNTEEGQEAPEVKGLAFLLNTNRMLVDPYWSVSIDTDMELKGYNKDIDLGLDMKTDDTYTFDVHNLASLLLKSEFASIALSVLGGWSTYYFSEYVK